MADLAGALLQAMLGFADRRIRTVEAAGLSSAAGLADALGDPGPGADLPGAESELTLARTSLAAFRVSLTGPATVAGGREAAGHLASALRHVDTAVVRVRPDRRLPAVLGDAFATPIGSGGIAAQLGLRTPAGLTVEDNAVTYRVRSAGAATLPGVLPPWEKCRSPSETSSRARAWWFGVISRPKMQSSGSPSP